MEKYTIITRSKETVLLEHTVWPYLEERSIIKEGLIITHSIGVVVRVLRKLGYEVGPVGDPWHRNYININGMPATTSLVLRDVDISDKEKFKNLLGTLQVLGYYIAIMEDQQEYKPLNKQIEKDILKLGIHWEARKTSLFNLVIEAKYDVEVEIGPDFPKFLYHTTLNNKVPKILKIGLSPKSGEKLSLHPGRVYLAGSIETAAELADMMHRMDPPDKLRIILKIQTSKLRSHTRFFMDPNANDAIYTYDNIPPDAISVDNQ